MAKYSPKDERLGLLSQAPGEMNTMIMAGMRVFLFGMAGVFIVMGIIVLALKILEHIGKIRRKDETDQP